MEIPELQLQVGGRALGGRFSTAEGLLRATADQLAAAPGALGDAPSLSTAAMAQSVNTPLPSPSPPPPRRPAQTLPLAGSSRSWTRCWTASARSPWCWTTPRGTPLCRASATTPTDPTTVCAEPCTVRFLTDSRPKLFNLNYELYSDINRDRNGWSHRTVVTRVA